MAVTKNELLDILGKSISADLAAEGMPTPQKEPVFSEDFEQSMNEFFAKGSSAKKKNKVRPKRWLIIAIAAVVALAATACAVPEIRESIAGFFVKVFGNHVEYTDPTITKNSIEEDFGLMPIPDGLIESEEMRTDVILVTNYSDMEKVIIILTQQAGAGTSDLVDNENGDIEECTIGEKQVLLHYTEYGAQASWIQEGYYFSLEYPSYIELNEFKDLINLVAKK